jgi:hypothetical protein
MMMNKQYSLLYKCFKTRRHCDFTSYALQRLTQPEAALTRISKLGFFKKSNSAISQMECALLDCI